MNEADEPEDDTVFCATCGKPRDPIDLDINGDCVPCRVQIFLSGERR